MKPIRQIAAILVIFFLTQGLVSCNTASYLGKQDPTARYSGSQTVVAHKVFPLTGALVLSPGASKVLKENVTLDSLSRVKKTAITQALKTCRTMGCLVKSFSYSKAEEQVASAALASSFAASKSVRDLVQDKLRPSGYYALFSALGDAALLEEAWHEQVAGMDYIFRAYLLGKGMQYPKIDSSRFYVRSRAYFDSVRAAVKAALETESEHALYFQPVLDAGLAILKLNGRDEAVRFEPLEQTNKAAYARFSHTQWKQYSYSAILVFGEGPEDPGVEISVHNKQRCEAAARLFQTGKAPFLIVSGGYVHPIQTHYCEAQEMKRFMVDSLKVPASAIIMEPHARHTTTNIRNANRIIYRNHMPDTMAVLGVSSESHIAYIASPRFDKVCDRDLGYMPYDRLKRLAPDQVEYFPTIRSLQVNSLEPLDP